MQMVHLANEVEQRVHLHEVVLDRRARDDDPHPRLDLCQPLHQLYARVLQPVTLRCQAKVRYLHFHGRVAMATACFAQSSKLSRCLSCGVMVKTLAHW